MKKLFNWLFLFDIDMFGSDHLFQSLCFKLEHISEQSSRYVYIYLLGGGGRGRRHLFLLYTNIVKVSRIFFLLKLYARWHWTWPLNVGSMKDGRMFRFQFFFAWIMIMSIRDSCIHLKEIPETLIPTVKVWASKSWQLYMTYLHLSSSSSWQ